jgi:photosystem II stability/assembly factor-like uncharacterized protein
MHQKLLLFVILLLSFTLCKVQEGFGQWVPTNAPSDDSLFTGCFAVSGTNLVAGTEEGESSEGILLSTNNGATWVASTTGLPANESVFALADADLNASSPMLFAGTEGGVYLSTDHGRSWGATNNGFPTNQHAISFAVVGANTSSPMIFVGTNSSGVFRSTDNGTSWTASGLASMSVLALAVSGNNLIAGGQGPNQGIYLSTDNGLHWTADTTGLPPYETIQCLAVSGTNGSSPMVFAGTGHSVFLSTNKGLSWTAAHTGLEQGYVRALATSGTNIFAATPDPNDSIYDGVFLSTDNGASWSSVNTGLKNTGIDVWTLAVIDTFVYAGSQLTVSHSSDIWRRPLSQMIGLNAVSQNSQATQNAAQAYPNPFPAKTLITISPIESGIATVTIVNLLGQEVAQLFDGELTASEHSFTWDATGVAPGSYWCIARMDDRTERIALSVQR